MSLNSTNENKHSAIHHVTVSDMQHQENEVIKANRYIACWFIVNVAQKRPL